MEKKPRARHERKKVSAKKALVALAAAMLAFAVYNLYLSYNSNAAVNESISLAKKAAEEASRPASLQITKILAGGCSDCFDVSQIEEAIRRLNVNASARTIDSESAEAKQLISKYGIKKVPALLITGEAEKAGIGFWSQIGTKESDGTLVLRYGAPYIDPSTGAEFGKVRLINIADKTCGSCYNVSIQHDILKDGLGLVFSGINTYDASSLEGAKLVSLYNITKIPTILLSPDAKHYEGLQGIWKQVGTVEKDGWYVFREMRGLINVLGGTVPYKDLSLNKTVNITE